MAEGDTGYDVFVSYSHADGEWVLGWLLPRLRAAGLRVCVDVESFDVGVPSLVNMERAVANSRHTLLVLTPAWVASEWTEFEALLTQTADPAARRRRLLPLLLVDCTPPARLALLTYADFRAEAAREDQVARVLAACQGQMNLRDLGPALAALLPAAPSLHTLRAPVGDFTGRAKDIEVLAGHLSGDGGTATITGIRGMGGIGKTELALKVAHELRERYPDAGLMFELQPSDMPLTPEAVLGTVIHAFQPELRLPDELAERQGVYRQVLAGQRGLLLLDNAAGPEQVRPLLSPPAGWAVVVTSRARFPLPGARLHDLELLPLAEAVALLGRLLSDGGRGGRGDTETGGRGDAETGGRGDAGEWTGDSGQGAVDGGLRELAERCGRLPLALRVAAGFLTTYDDWTLADYLAALARARLAHLNAPGEPAVQAVLGVSIDRLRERDAVLAGRWVQLAAFPAPFDRAAAAAVWGELGDAPADDVDAWPELTPLAEAAARQALSALRQQSLLEHDAASATYSLHDLLRECALAAAPADLAGARLRHAWHYLALGRAADALYRQGGAHVTAGLQQFDGARPHLAAAWAALAAPARRADAAAQRWVNAYPDAVAYVWALRAAARDRIPVLEAAAAAAWALGDRRGEGNHLGSLGSAYAALGEAQRAIGFHEQALAISREIGDRRGEGNHLGSLGSVYAALGEAQRAIGFHEQALGISREIGDRRGEAGDLGNLGNAYWDLGVAQRAIGSYEQALAISREIGDRLNEGAWLNNLGNVYAALGDAQRARELRQDALRIFEEIQWPYAAILRKWLAEYT